MTILMIGGNTMEKTIKSPKTKSKLALKILLIFAITVAVICIVLTIVSFAGIKSNSKFISTIAPVEYENQLVPEQDSNGYNSFTTDEPLKVMQLTDIHIGAGFLTIKKDNMAINAVASMITAEKPDLVVVTGDIAYPVPFQAGTFNNKTSAKLFAQLMEQLGVYWCPVFGNHDTELYSYYSRENIADFYSSDKYPHCLFQAGPDDVDGFGNYPITVKNSNSEITQALIMLDSHSYVDNDYLGIMWKYDTIHENQVEWYENTLELFSQENGGAMPKSLCFFHIPIPEYKQAWDEYTQSNSQDTESVKYIHGEAGEKNEVVYPSNYNYGFFDTALKLGSTQAMFCGHDHLNNFALNYKGIGLNYGYSIDYLAYIGIKDFGQQRGCTIIDINPDGSYESRLENYYQDKYVSVKEKETPDLEHGMYDEDK